MSDDATERALETLRQAELGAKVVQLPKREKRDPDPEPELEPDQDGDPRDAGGGGEPPRNAHGLPDGCPVVPLGKEANTFYFLNALHELIALSPQQHNHNYFRALFAPMTHVLEDWWPRKKEDKDTGEWKVVGFKSEACAEDLMNACARVGVWNPQERVRGLGAWLDDDANLVLHCGSKLVTRGEVRKTGYHQGYVYPAYRATPLPYDGDVEAGPHGPADELLQVLSTWNWTRAQHNIDATLMLGWIGAAMVGGALDWRPMCFVTGDKASGKSTIHRLLKWLFDGAIIQTADTSAAGLYQQVGHGSLPIAVDELEAEADNRRTQAVIRLARLASSGSVMLRGGAEHKGVEFQARSCFLFSSILMPPLEAQDRSRMAILRLKPLPRGQTPPVITPSYYRDLGRKLRRRLIDQWPRFQDTLNLYVQTLAAAGHDSRGCDQFGSLLACADLLLNDHLPHADELAEWEVRLKASAWRELSDTKSNAEKCLDWLLQSQPEAWRGGSRKTVGELVDEWWTAHNPAVRDDAQNVLKSAALRIVSSRGTDYLAVPVAHRQIGELYATSAWNNGGWTQALERLDGAQEQKSTRVAGIVVRATHVPLTLFVSDENQSAQSADAASPTFPQP